MLTQERAELLSNILAADTERAKTLLALETDEAVKQINSLGHDFTADELREFGQALTTAVSQGNELDAEALDSVAGGIAPLIAGAIVAAAAAIGKAVGSHLYWK